VQLDHRILENTWVFQARPNWGARSKGVVDGDTLDLTIDKGMGDYSDIRVRVLGIDTPEMRGEEREEGQQAKRVVQKWIEDHCSGMEKWPLLIETYKADSFGRYLARVQSAETGHDLTVMLLEKGYKPYFK
jgi:micrococcal nuclease